LPGAGFEPWSSSSLLSCVAKVTGWASELGSGATHSQVIGRSQWEGLNGWNNLIFLLDLAKITTKEKLLSDTDFGHDYSKKKKKKKKNHSDKNKGQEV
jgi:hypothetical protein